MKTIPSLGNSKTLRLPVSSWGNSILECIQLGIRCAWIQLINSNPNIIRNGSEEAITAELEPELVDVMAKGVVDGFTENIFQTIVRGAKFKNYDGSMLEKSPDLSIRRLTTQPGLNRDFNDALQVECKLIDANNGKDFLLYIKNGILRYVDGEYGWAMSDGIMLGYVRDDRKCLNEIKSKFRRNGSKEPYSRCVPISGFSSGLISGVGEQSYRTSHSRAWKYPKPMSGSAPGSIVLHHLWLSCP